VFQRPPSRNPGSFLYPINKLRRGSACTLNSGPTKENRRSIVVVIIIIIIIIPQYYNDTTVILREVLDGVRK
jgi:hypothetical protein